MSELEESAEILGSQSSGYCDLTEASQKKRRLNDQKSGWKAGKNAANILAVTRSALPPELKEIDTTDLETNTKVSINTNLKVDETLQIMKKLFGNAEASARLTSVAVLMAHEEVLTDMAQLFALRNLSSWLSPSEALLLNGKGAPVKRRMLFNERLKRMLEEALKEMEVFGERSTSAVLNKIGVNLKNFRRMVTNLLLENLTYTGLKLKSGGILEDVQVGAEKVVNTARVFSVRRYRKRNVIGKLGNMVKIHLRALKSILGAFISKLKYSQNQHLSRG